MSKIYYLVFCIQLLLLVHFSSFACSNCTPLYYTENRGQWEKDILYKTELSNGAIFLEKNKITFNLFNEQEFIYHRNHAHEKSNFVPQNKNVLNYFAYQISFQGANENCTMNRTIEQEGYNNYFIGNDRSKWTSHVHSYENIFYNNIYNHISLRIGSDNNAYKYEFICEPGSNTNEIKLNYNGVKNIYIKNNRLYIVTSFDTIIEQSPYAYQMIDGKQQKVACKYQLENNLLSFNFPNNYNPSIPLIIDPVVIFSTYSGSTADNFGYCATYDSRGNAYAGGSAFGNGYPITLGAYQVSWAGGSGAGSLIGTDIAITKYSSNGRTRIYSTYLGGNSDEQPHSLIVNSNDELFILGTTSSPNFPHTNSAYDTTYNGGPRVVLNGLGLDFINGSDLIVTRMSANGANLIASTYLGGTGNDGLNTSLNLKVNYADEVRGEIQIDELDNVYIGSSTWSTDFPTTSGAFQTTNNGGQDGCLIKLDNFLSTLIYSTYIGGSNDDVINSVEIDKAKNLYFSGGTTSTDFPMLINSYRNYFSGGRSDGYVAKINTTGTSLISATYIGTNVYDQSYFVRLNKAEEVFLFGQTLAPADSFIKNALYFNLGGGQFITKFKNSLDTIVWSTAFGTGAKIDISPSALLVDLCSKVYLAGWGGAVNISEGASGIPFGGTSGLAITPDAFQSTTDNSDFYLLVIADDASAISFGSYFGGPTSVEHVDGGTSRFDKNGVIYQSVCASCGRRQDFPIYPSRDSVVSASNNSSNCNNAIFKIDFNLPIIVANFDAPSVLCAPAVINFSNTSRTFPTTTYEWDFGDGTTSTIKNPTHTYNAFGTYSVRLIIRDPSACNLADTAYQNIFVLQNGKDTLVSLRICDTQTLQIGFPPINDTNVSYIWTPNTQLNLNDIANPYANVTGNIIYTCFINYAGCTDTFTQVVEIDSVEIAVYNDSVACPFDTVRLYAINLNPADILTYNWSPSSNIVGSTSGSSIAGFTTDSTTFTLIATNSTGCSNQTTARIYTQLSIPRIIADFNFPSTKCIPATINFNNLSTQQSRSGFNWNFGDATSSNLLNPSHTYSDTGTYTIRLIQNYSTLCTIADTTYDTLHLRFPIMDTFDKMIICENNQTQIGYINSDSSIHFSWFPNTTLSNDTISNPIASPINSTLYTCSINDANCLDTILQFVEISRPAILTIDTIVNCPNIGVYLYVANLVPGDTFSYEWFPLSNIISNANTNHPYVFTEDSTYFRVIATNQYGCMVTDTILLKSITDGVQVIASANQDSAEYLEEIQLTAISSDLVNYNWQPMNQVSNALIYNPTSIIYQSTIFVVQVEDSFGCIDIDSVIVYRKALKCGQSALFIPNAFSPNNDGNNDVFYIRGKNLSNFRFAIFDRWGEKVFESFDINTGWDGTYKGKKLDPAVFGYIFEGKCENGDDIKDKGNITLIR